MTTLTLPTLLVTPRRAARPAAACEMEVLVRIQPPDADPSAHRRPLNLALVIDRSGSMDGAPLEEAKRCALAVVDRLAAEDRLALIAYDQRVDVLAPSAPLRDRDALRRILRGLRSGGQTALFGGWHAGAQQVLERARPDVLSRVMLLSDGQANHGEIDPGHIAGACAAAAERGAATSTYGLGHHFNERLMTEMARRGGGQAWYGETAADLAEPFNGELDLLGALFAQRVTLRAQVEPGVGLRPMNDHPEIAARTWRLPDLAYGAEAWALFSLAVPAASERLVTFSASYEDLRGAPYELSVPPLVLPMVDDAGWRALVDDELVLRRLAEVRAADLQDRARAAAACHDWETVRALLDQARELARHSPWLGQIVQSLTELEQARESARFAKESTYAQYKLKQRLAPRVEGADPAVAEPAWLRRKRSQGRADG
ncbi:MAG: vWA domain-containing protein [Candidatus Binatia bacterium]